MSCFFRVAIEIRQPTLANGALAVYAIGQEVVTIRADPRW